MVSSSSQSSPQAAGRPVASVRYELITLGDELLLGLTANSHLTFIGGALGRQGARLARNVTITDDADDIAAQFRESWARADVVITTGGLGPTCDDRTREVVAGVLGQELVFDESIRAAIEARFSKLGRRMTDNNLKQAYRFERGEVLPNANGTAPGLWGRAGRQDSGDVARPAERAATDLYRAGHSATRCARLHFRPRGVHPDSLGRRR